MKYFDEIERYLRGSMSEEEKELFDLKMSENQELREEFRKQKFEGEVLDFAVLNSLKEEVRLLREEKTAESSKTKGSPEFFLPIAIAASIVLLLGIFIARNRYAPERLAEAYYQFDVSSQNSRDIKEKRLTPVSDGLELLTQGAYDQAQNYFQELQKVDSVNIEASYYLGHVYFQSRKYPEALVSFEEVASIEQNIGPIADDAKYYALLAKLKLGEKDEAFENTLEELIQLHYPGAEDLQRKLNSFWSRIP